MKKSLSLLVAIAMVFSMFATVVSAAGPAEGQSAGEYLQELGVIKGNQDGDLKEDQTWKRQDIVVLLSRLLGVEAEAKAAAKTHEFTDVTDANYDGYISWAVEEGLVEGKGNGRFGFGDELKLQEFYALVLRAFKLEIAYDEVPAKAVELGLAEEGADFAGIPTRGTTYTTIVTALNTEVPGTGKKLGEILGLIEGPAVAASQTGVSKVTVQFNQAVDPEKVKFAVKNGVANRDVVKTTFSDDKKTAILELSSKLLDGASSVTVSGISENDLVSEFTAAAERVTEITFTSDKVALGTNASNQVDYQKVSVGYKIVNQFGEDVTRTAGGTLTFQVGKANATGTGNNGVLTITSTGAPFVFGESVYVSAVLNLNTYGVTATQTFTVGQQAMVDSVDILSVYHDDDKELMTNSTFNEFYILVDAKDQYGNNVTLQQFKDGVFASVSNGTLFTINKDHAVANVGPNNDKIGIPLTAPQTGIVAFDGTNTVRIQTLFGQKSDSIDVVVKKAATLTTFVLEQPTESVSTGTTVKIPFSASDQNGNALTNFSDLDGKVTLFASNSTTSEPRIQLKQDFSTKKAYIEWTAGPVGLNFLSATVIGTPNNSQLQINVVEAGYADSLAGFKDVNNTLVVGATFRLEPKHVVVKDQFGRDIKLADILGTHKLVVSAADGTKNVISSAYSSTSVLGEITNTVGHIDLNAAARGSERIKLELIKLSDSTVVATFENFTFSVIDNSSIDSYEVATVEKISNKSTDHDVTVKVTGKRGSATVELPASAYTVVASSPLVANGNKLSAAAIDDEDIAGGGTKATYTVTIIATGEVFVKEITITKETLVATKLEQKDAAGLKASGLVVTGVAGDVSDLAKVAETVKVIDQFGVEMNVDPEDFHATITSRDNVAGDPINVLNNGSLIGAETNPVSISGIDVGDSYSVVLTHKSNTGVQITVKVVAVPAT